MLNKNNYPKWFTDFIIRQSEDYDKGDSDYSVTQLLDAPRIVILQNRYGVEKDVDAMIPAAIGTYVHKGIEQDLPRIYMRVSDSIISGLADRIDGRVLTDFKHTRVYAYMDKDQMSKFRQQLLMYAYMYNKRYYGIDIIQNAFLFTDWMPSTAKRDRQYPQTRFLIHQWPFSEEELSGIPGYMESRVKSLEWNAKQSDRDLTLCSKEEMWYTGDVYAVMKKGRKSALKLYNTEEDAVNHVEDLLKRERPNSQGVYSIEYREGERVRCAQNHCGVAQHCDDWRAYCNEKN